MRLTMNAFLPASAAESLQEEETDQQVRRQAHAFPADEHQQVVVGEHQREHEEHEEVQVGEEAVVAVFVRHVPDGVNVDEEADAGDDQHHDERELVEVKPEIARKSCRPESRRALRGLQCRDSRPARSSQRARQHSRRCRGKEQGDGLDQRVREAAAEKSVDRRSDSGNTGISQRCKFLVISFSRFTRSTFKVSRVRNTAMMMASPTAASAAATTMTKKTKTWPLRGSAVAAHGAIRGEGHEAQVHGVEHQLNRHEDGDDVALDEKAGNAAGENRKALRTDSRKEEPSSSPSAPALRHP